MSPYSTVGPGRFFLPVIMLGGTTVRAQIEAATSHRSYIIKTFSTVWVKGCFNLFPRSTI